MINSVDTIMQTVHASTQNMGAASNSKDNKFDQMMTDKKAEQPTDAPSSSTSGSTSEKPVGDSESAPADGAGQVVEDPAQTSPAAPVLKVEDEQLELAAALLFQTQVMSYRPVEVLAEEPVVVEGEVEAPEEGEQMLELENQMLNLGDQSQKPLTQGEEVEVPLELSPELAEEEVDLDLEPVKPVVEEAVVEDTTALPEETVETQVDLEQDGEFQQENNLQTTQESSPVAKNTKETEEDLEVELDGDEVQQSNLFKKVESAPVKVAETVNAQEPDAGEQIANKLMKAVDDGDQTVTIQLTPENLGTITAQITRTADGLLQIVLQATNSEATNLLNSQLGNLISAMQSGGQSVTVEVQQPQESEEGQEQADAGANPDGKNQNEQSQDQRKDEALSEDFLQQMRLGLTDFSDELA